MAQLITKPPDPKEVVNIQIRENKRGSSKGLIRRNIFLIQTEKKRGDFEFYFNLVDLYVKKAIEVYCKNEGMPFPPWVKGLSSKILVSQDLDRVLEAKKKALGKK